MAISEYEKKLRDLFDEEAFRMVTDFSSCASTLKPDFKIVEEFVSPLLYNKELLKVEAVLGVKVVSVKGGEKKRIGVVLLLDPLELSPPIKKVRSLVRDQMRKIKKSFIKQLKEIE